MAGPEFVSASVSLPSAWHQLRATSSLFVNVTTEFALTEMAYTVVRLLQRFSRVEGRMGPEVGGQPGNEKGTGVDGVQESLVQRLGRSAMKMQSEIVMQPQSAVRVAFYD